ncbi:hypothetical protein [Thiocapsa bogorovii]|uniref:hypothetical protein n=1 Tax=Thiocapsa bogorovii TaxID=521689 RepID=UPI001E5530AE|nr:hypothetical protein [Thiocapsa bogorovii]UHD18116.1 hypothetical protein LT988_08800 [Thiocapsa bogorovii]
MRWTRGIRIAVIPALLLVALASSGAFANEPCLKMVFGHYCLGGDVGPLLQAVPPPLVRQEQDASLALVFVDGPDRLYVLAFNGKIYKVVRAFGVSTQLRYEETYAALRDIYGLGEDRSRFSSDATTPGRRLVAIRRGEGIAMHVWTPSPTWRIELSWTREMGLSLAYVATELSAARAAQIDRGF